MKHTNEQIASDYNLWIEYVDTTGVDTREQWEAMTRERKLEIIAECFGA